MFTKILATILLGVGITACQPSLVAEGKNTNPQPVVQQQEPVQIIPAPQPVTPAPTTVVVGEVKDVAPTDDIVYIVKRNDNITNIAKHNLPEGITLNQMIAAIYYHNEDCFLYRNVNVVKVGAKIKIPSKIRASAIDKHDAYALVYMHELEWQELSYSVKQKNTPL